MVRVQKLWRKSMSIFCCVTTRRSFKSNLMAFEQPWPLSPSKEVHLTARPEASHLVALVRQSLSVSREARLRCMQCHSSIALLLRSGSEEVWIMVLRGVASSGGSSRASLEQICQSHYSSKVFSAAFRKFLLSRN